MDDKLRYKLLKALELDLRKNSDPKENGWTQIVFDEYSRQSQSKLGLKTFYDVEAYHNLKRQEAQDEVPLKFFFHLETKHPRWSDFVESFVNDIDQYRGIVKIEERMGQAFFKRDFEFEDLEDDEDPTDKINEMYLEETLGDTDENVSASISQYGLDMFFESFEYDFFDEVLSAHNFRDTYGPTSTHFAEVFQDYLTNNIQQDDVDAEVQITLTELNSL